MSGLGQRVNILQQMRHPVGCATNVCLNQRHGDWWRLFDTLRQVKYHDQGRQSSMVLISCRSDCAAGWRDCVLIAVLIIKLSVSVLPLFLHIHAGAYELVQLAIPGNYHCDLHRAPTSFELLV